MDDDGQIISFEDAVRRHRALQEQRSKGVRREVQISDAMSHLLHDANAEDEEGPKPARLREIVARAFAPASTTWKRVQAAVCASWLSWT